MYRKSGLALAMMAILSLLLSACGGAADTPTSAPVPTTAPTVAAVAPTTAPTAMAAMTPTAMAAAMTPTAMMAAMTPTAMAAMTPTAMSAMTPTAMVGMTPTASGGLVGGGGTAMTPADYGKIGPELAAAWTGAYKGTKVTMYGPFAGEDQIKFNNSMKEFEAKTGIDIQYEGTKDFEATINVRVEGGNPPDIADFPQPGLMASFAPSPARSSTLNKMCNADWLKQNYNQGYLDIDTVMAPSGKILGGVFAARQLQEPDLVSQEGL